MPQESSFVKTQKINEIRPNFPFVRPLPWVQNWEIWQSTRAYFIRERSTFAYYNLTLSESICLFASLILKNKSKSLWHTEKFAKSFLQKKSPLRMRTKRQNRKLCRSLCFISCSPCHWQAPRLSQQCRPLSSRTIDFQTTLSSRSRLESRVANCSLPAQQTRHQYKNCVQLYCGARRLQRANTTNFSAERRSFQSVHSFACLSAACTRKMAVLR